MSADFDINVIVPDDATIAKIEASFVEYNAQRPGVASAQMRNGTLFVIAYGAALLFIVIFLLQMKAGGLLGVVAGLGIFLGIFLWNQIMQPAKDFQQDLRNRMMPVIFSFVDDFSYGFGYVPRFMSRMPEKHFVSFTHAKHNDRISGKFFGMPFELSETKLTRGTGKNETTVFNGVILHVVREDYFNGTLIANTKLNAVQRLFRDTFTESNFYQLQSKDPELEERYEFFSDNWNEGAALVGGDLAAALTYLNREWRDGPARIAFSGKECFILLSSKDDFFELPSIETDLVYQSHARPMIHQLVTLLMTARLVSRVGMKAEEPPSSDTKDGTEV